jgi:serpin B
VKTDFVDRNRIAYLAEVSTRDFDDDATVDEINDWVSERTHEKIPSVLDPPIPADAIMYLINAIYFNGSWAEQFDKTKTTDRTFTLTSGVQKPVPTMFRHDQMDYLETESFQAARLPYGDGRFSAYVFLPKTGHTLDSFHASLSAENWKSWLGSFSLMQGTLYLPKFEFRYKTDLKRPLSRLGMGVAFSGAADFTGIADAALTISDARHMSYVRLNEEGTEAAAVTIIGVFETSVPMTFTMDVNRPFFFAIADSTTGSILFMGSVLDPAS